MLPLRVASKVTKLLRDFFDTCEGARPDRSRFAGVKGLTDKRAPVRHVFVSRRAVTPRARNSWRSIAHGPVRIPT